VPTRVLGGGSNVLADDGDLPFVVLDLGAAGQAAAWEGCRARVPAGLPLSAVLRESLKRGCAGLEWAAGLPGSVGGAVVGNAGAFGGDVARHVRAVALLSADGTVRRHEVAAGDFGYRRSFVRQGEVVLEVELELAPGDPVAMRAEVDRVNRIRTASQPKGGHSCGCIFKNPAGDHAGRLVDGLGLKGRRVGGAFVSPAHANFIVNDGTATATDVLRLIDLIRAEVRERAGVELELEIRAWRAGSDDTDGGAP
jgi:UDP-N-acetylmuramate dehydrogenase